MLEVAVGATMRCKITTYLQPPKGVLQLMLTFIRWSSLMTAAMQSLGKQPGNVTM